MCLCCTRTWPDEDRDARDSSPAHPSSWPGKPLGVLVPSRKCGSAAACKRRPSTPAVLTEKSRPSTPRALCALAGRRERPRPSTGQRAGSPACVHHEQRPGGLAPSCAAARGLWQSRSLTWVAQRSWWRQPTSPQSPSSAVLTTARPGPRTACLPRQRHLLGSTCPLFRLQALPFRKQPPERSLMAAA